MNQSPAYMIETRDLRVDYGDFTAVSDVNLAIPAGEIFGLIGPNGAGKTTTIRVLATLLEPTYGDVFLGGHDIVEKPREVHGLLGYMPDFAPVYAELKVWEFLDLFAAAYSVPREQRTRRIDEGIYLANLGVQRDALAGTLSRGMKQRLVLAKTLMHDPQVLLLDEPASGLDPRARIELREMLRKLVKTGKTILVSSHILTELSGFCSSIGIMDQGRMMVCGKIEDIIKEMSPQKTLVVELLNWENRFNAALGDAVGVEEVKRDERRIVVTFSGTDEQAVAYLAHLVGRGLPVKGFSEQRMDVEDVFMKVGRSRLMAELLGDASSEDVPSKDGEVGK